MCPFAVCVHLLCVSVERAFRHEVIGYKRRCSPVSQSHIVDTGGGFDALSVISDNCIWCIKQPFVDTSLIQLAG